RRLPPVDPRPDSQHDAVLWRRLMRPRRDEQAGLANPVGLELLDDHAVEERAQDASRHDMSIRSAAGTSGGAKAAGTLAFTHPSLRPCEPARPGLRVPADPRRVRRPSSEADVALRLR